MGHRTPGQLLEELLASRKWSKRTLAAVIAMDESSVGKIVAGKKKVDAELALVLAEVFETEADQGLADQLLTLQRSYDLELAKIVSKPDPDRARRAHLFGDLPVSDMIKRRWIDVEDMRDVAAVERALAKFFGVSSPSEIEVLPHAAKKTNVFGAATPTQIAWLYQVRRIASGMLATSFSETAARDAVRRLVPLRSNADDVRKVPRVLSESGIRFVIVESLPSAKIDGVCMWLSDDEPVIGLTMRHDRIDNFWFVLRHELEHVIRGHGRTAMMLDIEIDNQRDIEPDEERVANEAAAHFCVPQEMMAKFIARKSPFFADRDILAFAHTIGTHPGLVAGQLQRRTNRYDRFRAHQVKVRSLVSPGSVIDGWGDAAPLEP